MNSQKTASFHRSLHEWYGICGRQDLPWRNTNDPYAIYVSEVMLQQTQVRTVLERYYHPFLEAFPTLIDLANAPQDDVLSKWQGLGYYNRAINLHKAAKTTEPTLPNDLDALIALPGIGQNTAYAILAFAFHQPVAILEANVKRVLHRIFALEKASPKELWDYAEQLLNRDKPFDYNQAMMDLGSLICTPKSPDCANCPAAAICKGKESPQAYPEPKKRKVTPTRHKNIVVVRDANHRYYATARNSRFLNGLFGFIEIDKSETQTKFQGETLHLNKQKPIGHVSQTYSHFKLDADVYLVKLKESFNSADWHSVAKLSTLPMSRADEKIVKLISS